MPQHPFTTPSVVYLGQSHCDAGAAGTQSQTAPSTRSAAAGR